METGKSVAGDKFVKLEAFDFKNNRVFQDGWKKIKAVVSPEMLFESLVKAQVFFFSREVEPINLEEYKTWLINKGTDKEEYINNFVPDSDGNKMGDASETETETVNVNTKIAIARAGKHPESFSELIEMIQNGIQLPDTEGPEIKPINDEPTPPVEERKKKPWENT